MRPGGVAVLWCLALQVHASLALQLHAGGRLQHVSARSRCLLRCSEQADSDDEALPEATGDISFSALRNEMERRGPADLGKFAAMHQLGPHHTTTPKQVVEHVITELREGNISQAFQFSCVPVTKRGTHKTSTDWSQRMAWEKCNVINGAPSGRFVDLTDFEAMVKSRYAALLDTEQFRFVGDASPWQQKQGHEKMTAVKDYVVEVKTRSKEHLLLKFKLVYDWLLFCHLVASVDVMSVDRLGKHFPGSEDLDLSI